MVSSIRKPSEKGEIVKLVDEDGLWIVIVVENKQTATEWVLEQIGTNRKVITYGIFNTVPNSTVVSKTELRKLKIEQLKK